MTISASGFGVGGHPKIVKLIYGTGLFTATSTAAVLSGSSGISTFTVSNLNAGERVFVHTGSMPPGTFVYAASAVSASTLQVLFRNSACTAAADAPITMFYQVEA